MTSSAEACCTCATLFSSASPPSDPQSEKGPPLLSRQLDCCGRAICHRCITSNKRFESYCPFCQISIKPSPLPPGLRDPPHYDDDDQERARTAFADSPPPYMWSEKAVDLPDEKRESSATLSGEDVLHFVDHKQDTVPSLCMRYGVPIAAFRKKNHLFADNLMAARRTVLIPGEYYKGGVSLSPRPIEGEEEERKKTAVRRFMTTCKVHDYNVAEIYLKQAQYDLEMAIGVYNDDEKWERDNPLSASNKHGKAKARIPGSRRS